MVNLGVLVKTFNKNNFKINQNMEYGYLLHLNELI